MPIKLLQITDCHLGEKAEGEALLGLNTDDSLDYVLSHMLAEHESADLLVCSGDLSNEGGEVAYQRLQEKLPKHIPQAWLPGNHDDNKHMVKYASGPVGFLSTQVLGQWQITLLDSSIPHEVPGKLEQSELDRAVRVLESSPDKHHIIFMHHHLQPVGCAWLDTQVVDNAPQVLAKFAEYPQLKAVVCGHVHQESRQKYQHISLYSTPSTCIQFKPNSDDFAVGKEMPGYRWLVLNDDGTLITQVSRIAERDLNIDWGSAGY